MYRGAVFSPVYEKVGVSDLQLLQVTSSGKCTMSMPLQNKNTDQQTQ